jgi:hypothetical protein
MAHDAFEVLLRSIHKMREKERPDPPSANVLVSLAVKDNEEPPVASSRHQCVGCGQDVWVSKQQEHILTDTDIAGVPMCLPCVRGAAARENDNVDRSLCITEDNYATMAAHGYTDRYMAQQMLIKFHALLLDMSAEDVELSDKSVKP